MMDVIRLSVLGGVLGLDGTSVGQFMTGRPLVAGFLAGWVAGEAALGAAVGAILELYLLVSFPTGGARFPDGATATVVAVASAAPFMDSSGVLLVPGAAAGAGGMAAVPLAVAIGLFWGQLGGLSISILRKANGRLAPAAGDDPGVRRRVEGTHLASIALDAVRGFVVTLSGIVAGRLILGATVHHWPLSAAGSMGLLLAGGAVSAGILLHDAGGFRRRRLWFAAGLAAGIVGVRFL